MFNLLYEHYPALAALVVGLLTILWPPPVRRSEEEERQRRLAELERGADEAYLEERRALETYGPGSAGPFRFFGALLLGIGLALFLL